MACFAKIAGFFQQKTSSPAQMNEQSSQEWENAKTHRSPSIPLCVSTLLQPTNFSPTGKT
jgi:hypothetical protein